MIDLKPAPNGYMSPQDPGEPGRNQPRWSVNDTEARIIGELCKGRIVLEVGTGLGVSTRAILKTCERIMTVDSDPWVWENVFPQLQQEYNHRVVCHELKADKIVTPTRFEAFFLDGYHEYNQVKADIANYRPQLKSGAIMIFHDLYIDGVYRGIIDSGLTPLHIQTTAGIGVCWND